MEEYKNVSTYMWPFTTENFLAGSLWTSWYKNSLRINGTKEGNSILWEEKIGGVIDACTKYHLSLLKHFSKSITEQRWSGKLAKAILSQMWGVSRMLKSCYATICQSLIVCRGFSFCTHFINDSNFRLLAPHSLLWLPSPCFWLVGWILHNYP